MASLFFTSYSFRRPMLISSAELSRRTGVSYRKIDFWCNNGVIFPVGDPSPGSGYQRKFDEEIVPKVRLLGKICEVFDHAIRIDKLIKIYENYHHGFVKLEHRIVLSWWVED